jgi:hypothetical protein
LDDGTHGWRHFTNYETAALRDAAEDSMEIFARSHPSPGKDRTNMTPSKNKKLFVALVLRAPILFVGTLHYLIQNSPLRYVAPWRNDEISLLNAWVDRAETLGDKKRNLKELVAASHSTSISKDGRLAWSSRPNSDAKVILLNRKWLAVEVSGLDAASCVVYLMAVHHDIFSTRNVAISMDVISSSSEPRRFTKPLPDDGPQDRDRFLVDAEKSCGDGARILFVTRFGAAE